MLFIANTLSEKTPKHNTEDNECEEGGEDEPDGAEEGDDEGTVKCIGSKFKLVIAEVSHEPGNAINPKP